MTHTEETKTKLANLNIGRQHSPETRAKIAQAQAGRKQSLETRLKNKYSQLVRHGMDPTQAQQIIDQTKLAYENASPLQSQTPVVDTSEKSQNELLRQINALRQARGMQPFDTYTIMSAFKITHGSYTDIDTN